MELEVGGLYIVQYKHDNDDKGSVQQCLKIAADNSYIRFNEVTTGSSSFIERKYRKDYKFTYIGKLPTLQELAKEYYPELFI